MTIPRAMFRAARIVRMLLERVRGKLRNLLCACATQPVSGIAKVPKPAECMMSLALWNSGYSACPRRSKKKHSS